MKIRLALAAALVLAVSGAAASSASAGSYLYGCGVIAPNTWCLASQIHTYDGNIATYPGSGSINLCSKLTMPYSNPEYLYARRCDLAQSVVVYSDGGGRAPYPNGSVDMNALVANGNNCCGHTIDGDGVY
ncbi:MAG: hypothetical protein ACTHOE_14470 [Conexibacter sp.]